MLKVSESGQEYIDEGEDGTLDAMLEALEALVESLPDISEEGQLIKSS